MAQRPAMGRIEARGPAIVAPSDSVGGLSSVSRGGIVEQPLSVAADGPEMGILGEKRPVVGISWIGAPVVL